MGSISSIMYGFGGSYFRIVVFLGACLVEAGTVLWPTDDCFIGEARLPDSYEN